MCGIFGVSVNHESKFTPRFFQSVVGELFKLSESRGKEASGLALSIANEIHVLKSGVSASQLMKGREYKQFFDSAFSRGDSSVDGRIDEPVTLIGHSRMETDGSHRVHENNQPVLKNGIVTVHNGIIVNHMRLWERNPDLKREWEVDTEIIPALIKRFCRNGTSLTESVRLTYQQIEGVASIASLFDQPDQLLLATNNGSLYVAHSPALKAIFFASEKYMLTVLIRKFSQLASCKVAQVRAGRACLISLSDLSIWPFSLTEGEEAISQPAPAREAKRIKDLTARQSGERDVGKFEVIQNLNLENLLEDNSRFIDGLKRCSKCLLPETFPFIEFDPEGVCNVCRSFTPMKYKGVEALRNLVAPHRKRNGEPDCIVALSGGRDSTFTLHYLKTNLGMNPVAYTYDWGMVTPLTRRNISRICSKLGIEHVLVSADIQEKRKFIKQNVTAWLKRPRLGTIPLFMAGDKQFFYYGHELKKRMGTDLLLFGMNSLERTDFKVAFAGIRPAANQPRHYHLSMSHKLQLAAFYGVEYFKNPAYFNSSLVDTLFAFASYYLIEQKFHNFFEYFKWDEEFITQTIRDRYDWEVAPDTPSTWRIGDGTAAFYNYVYYNVAGFSENDTFRSNQIRQGIITREEALRKVQEENRPRFESIKWYCETIGIDFAETIEAVNQIPKLYLKVQRELVGAHDGKSLG